MRILDSALLKTFLENNGVRPTIFALRSVTALIFVLCVAFVSVGFYVLADIHDREKTERETMARFLIEGGLVGETNAKMSVEWWEKSATQGIVLAQVKLGQMYALGEGVAKDEVKAVEWLRKAAEQGNSQAQTWLGQRYARGRGVAKDEVQAVEWFRKAAEQGNSQAQTLLGQMYFVGEVLGLPKDEVKAVEWIRKAAEQGNSEAQTWLGQMYAKGQGIAKDEVKAVEWLKKGASGGDAMAQRALGSMYMLGAGTVKDLVLGYAWINIGSQEEETALVVQKALKQMMTNSEIAESKRLSSAWKKGTLLAREATQEMLSNGANRDYAQDSSYGKSVASSSSSGATGGLTMRCSEARVLVTTIASLKASGYSLSRALSVIDADRQFTEGEKGELRQIAATIYSSNLGPRGADLAALLACK